MTVQVETFQTMQRTIHYAKQDIVQLKDDLGNTRQKIHDQDQEIIHLKETYKQLQVDAREELEKAEQEIADLREKAEQEIADLREENKNLDRMVKEMETRALDTASVPRRNNPDRPAATTTSGSSLVQARDKSGRYTAGYTKKQRKQ